MTDSERGVVVAIIERITGKMPHVRWSPLAEGGWVAESGLDAGDSWARGDSVDDAFLCLLRALVQERIAP